jgi:hypothetical protein
MKKVLIGLVLLVMLPVVVVSADTDFSGVSQTLDESMRETYPNYIYRYNELKAIAEQYENNMVLDMSDIFQWYRTEDFDDTDGVNSDYQPLGKYDYDYITERLGVDVDALQEKVDAGATSIDNGLTKEETIYLMQIDFEYYYNYEDDSLIQVMRYVDTMSEYYQEKISYNVWNSEGVISRYDTGQ